MEKHQTCKLKQIRRHICEDGITPVSSLQSFLWVITFDREPSCGDVGCKHLLSGEGELMGCNRFPLLGGLSITPSLTAFVEKSIVNRALAAEYIMYLNPLWDMLNCPQLENKSTDAAHFKFGTKETCKACEGKRQFKLRVQGIYKPTSKSNNEQVKIIGQTKFEHTIPNIGYTK